MCLEGIVAKNFMGLTHTNFDLSDGKTEHLRRRLDGAISHSMVDHVSAWAVSPLLFHHVKCNPTISENVLLIASGGLVF